MLFPTLAVTTLNQLITFQTQKLTHNTHFDFKCNILTILTVLDAAAVWKEIF